MNLESAISEINRVGILLVFPINNKPEPPSLWSHFFSKRKMRWEWDDSGDQRVANLWHLREELSRSSEVVYTKWYQGRATFMSRPFFTALLARMNSFASSALMQEAREILELLEQNSPLSTKVIKKETGLIGKFNESTFQKAMKQLWIRLLIVGFGEIDDGAFPSLAVGATRLLFEGPWSDAENGKADPKILEYCLKNVGAYQRFYSRVVSATEKTAQV